MEYMSSMLEFSVVSICVHFALVCSLMALCAEVRDLVLRKLEVGSRAGIPLAGPAKSLMQCYDYP